MISSIKTVATGTFLEPPLIKTTIQASTEQGVLWKKILERRQKLNRLVRDFLKKESLYEEGTRKKNISIDFESARNLCNQWIKLWSELEEIGRQKNEVKKLPEDEAKKQGQILNKKLKELDNELVEKTAGLEDLLLQIPNPPRDDVKVGKDETENEVLRTWGELKKFDFQPKDYLTIGENLNIIDIERAAKVSGSRFGYLKGEAVLLGFALVHFALETLIKEGFVPVVPPVLIKKEVMGGMGYLEHGGEEDMYVFDKDELVLVGTSEQSLGPMHMNEVLEGSRLPLRYAGFSTCFRREAGSYGKDTKGILRVHQFDKVEMFSFTKPDDSDKEHEFFLSLEEKLFQALEIPYQVVKMCSGDLGAPAARKYDIEAWMPGQGLYREVTSTSTCTDFQARRLNINYRITKGIPGFGSPYGSTQFGVENSAVANEYVHTLNGTAFAIGRTLIAILENYQQEDGSVLIPKVLQKYNGFDKISPKKS